MDRCRAWDPAGLAHRADPDEYAHTSMHSSTVQRLLHWVRHAGDRLAHGSMRKEALARLRMTSLPRSVLVVCHGNLCRSPYAAAVLRQRFEGLGLPITVASAGYFNSKRSPPREALDAAAERGIDLSAHRPQLVTRALLDAADLVVVMDEGLSRAVQARRQPTSPRALVLGDLDPQPIATRAIADPIGNPRPAFDHCYARIDRCIAMLVQTLASRSESS